MSFFSGFVEGLASSADTSIKRYLESDNQLKSKLAEKRIARAETEEARFRKEFEQYKREIKGLSKKAGGVDNAQYILQKYGYDEGSKIINELYTKELAGGKSVSSLFELQERTGPSVTIDQLATFYTPPAKIGTGESMKGVGGGISKLFGGENWIQKAVLKETDAVVGKLTKASLSEIPEALSAIDDLENYEIGYSLDYTKEYKRLMSVATDFLDKGNTDKAAKIKIAAEANYLTMKNFDKSEYSGAELRAVSKDFEKKLVNVHDIKGRYDAYSNFISPAESKEKYKLAQEITTGFEALAQNARKNYSLDPTYIKLKLTEAITKNLTPVIVPPVDQFSKAIIKLTDEKLYNIAGSPTGTSTSSGLSGQYNLSTIPSTIANIQSLSGTAQSKAIINAQKLYSVDQAAKNQLDKKLRELGLL